MLIGDHTVGRLTGSSQKARARLRERVEQAFGRDLIVVGDGHGTPYFHIDMFLRVLDDHTLVLGDPKAALDALQGKWSEGGRLVVPGAGEFRKVTQERQLPAYKRIATQLVRAGFKLHRVPILHGQPPTRPDRPEVVLNWNNVVTEVREGQKSRTSPVADSGSWIARLPRSGARWATTST